MSVRNGLKGGTDWTTEHPSYQDLNDTNNAYYRKIYADNTGGTISNSTTETDLATITISQNDLGSSSSAIITSGSLISDASSGTNTVTFRLYVNGSVVKTITQVQSSAQAEESRNIVYFATGLDSTAGNIIIKVTGQNSQAVSTADLATCDSLLVEGIYDNS